jgi:hypothetical protein
MRSSIFFANLFTFLIPFERKLNQSVLEAIYKNPRTEKRREEKRKRKRKRRDLILES